MSERQTVSISPPPDANKRHESMKPPKNDILTKYMNTRLNKKIAEMVKLRNEESKTTFDGITNSKYANRFELQTKIEKKINGVKHHMNRHMVGIDFKTPIRREPQYLPMIKTPNAVAKSLVKNEALRKSKVYSPFNMSKLYANQNRVIQNMSKNSTSNQILNLLDTSFDYDFSTYEGTSIMDGSTVDNVTSRRYLNGKQSYRSHFGVKTKRENNLSGHL